MDDDAWVAADAIGQLAPPDVDGVDPDGAALEEDIGEAAGRGAGIEADEPGRVDRERVEGRRELVAAAAHVWIGLDEADLDRGVDEIAGLPIETRRITGTGPDLAREDQCLRSGARLGQPTLDDELVEPLTGAGTASRGLAHRAIVSQPTSRRLTRPDHA
jgi:hypothetical protein